MQIKLWGVRGSLPAPEADAVYKDKIKKILEKSIEQNINSSEKIDSFINNLPGRLKSNFGGNTTCVTVKSDSGKLYIIDCGTGIRPLGDEIIQTEEGRGNADIKIFMTHTHWDHVQGLPFFKPIYIPGNKLTFYSPIKDLQARFEYQQDFRFFPVKFEDMGAEKVFKTLKRDEVIEPEKGLQIDFLPLKHPGGSFAYRFRQNGKTFIFCTDAEFTGEFVEKIPPYGYDFFKDADLLVIDSQYTLDESFIKLYWGHTSYTMAVNCGIRWGVKKLILTHHEPSYSDDKLCTNLSEAKDHLSKMDSDMEIDIAIEGTIFNL